MTQLNVSTGNVNTCVYKKPDISKNDTVEVYASCIVEPHFFWCQYANTEDINKLSELAEEAGQAQQDMMFAETLGPGSTCLALFSSDNQWYRAQVIQRTDDTLHVMFIDYGNESDVDIKNVRSLGGFSIKKKKKKKKKKAAHLQVPGSQMSHKSDFKTVVGIK
uniref:Tudor domain-containing protein n=1 Tax=Lates calcarifer TaxID=8187 RepID=A0A4W6FT84_LATCA